MKYDIILAGVGGQGVLSVSAHHRVERDQEGLLVKQSEVHGMSQRGGAVLANLRLSDAPDRERPDSAGRRLDDPEHGAAREPPLPRYLSPEGALVTSTNPVVNIPDYPDLDGLLAAVRSLPFFRLVDGEKLARAAGSARATNMVMVGAASHRLPVKVDTLEHFIRKMFAAKGEKVVETNLKAFRAGREAAA